ncbi:MAG: GNAT family N-acetyltransferase [Candidatus Lokiarchaeota archaeon]|nr:GNAT family N-acetyltransferase [Candidatus Lokiarchaeota archaeon]MBD3200052.1 GNAT family N-acetyltransferase [Candidatus Lokiarchaeota archaeon]
MSENNKNKKDVREKPSFLKGERLDLRPPDADFKDLYFKWMNIPEARTFAHNVFPLTKEQINKWFEPREDESPEFISFDMWHKEDKKPIGFVGFNHINWVNRNANIFIRIGEVDYWRKGYATEAAKMVIDYGFLELNFHKIYAGVHSRNIASWTVAEEKIGFVKEAVLKDEVYVSGEYLDAYKYRLLRSEWEKLREKAKKH